MKNYNDIIYTNYPKSNYDKKFIKYLVGHYFPQYNSKILDVGCGNGKYIKLFDENYLLALGIDKNVDTNQSFLKKCDIEKEVIPYPDNYFDYVFSKSSIEHINNTDNFLSEIYRVLRPRGTLVILTPAWEYNYKDFYNDYTHIKPFHRKGLQDALKIHGFGYIQVDYFYHLPFMWKHPYLSFIPKFLSLFSKWKWKDKEQTKHRPLLRFSQEVQLFASARK
jgi:ubiquinone/menaquinone biosynthesis C-methylase UbiE